ncbi:hypothetical protein [Methylobacterium sp. J-067]|jgi:hypothetical protein|uniref:hypothetical protein n=1 Tax=Methylobacterium sp. J-067 TaxID=2836648 RepID=UPI001FBA9216|nr:hypothetical protein [Methylobacterium sp. J-067]MCJ2025174.1 hypothetical protein [Methylobacterium sp. J-067]
MADDEQTLGEILGVAEAAPSTWQEWVGGILLDAASQKPEAAFAPVQITVSDPLAWVDEQIRGATGRQVGNMPVWVRFFRPAQDIGALFVLSAPHPLDGADLVMVANRGMMTRGLIRDLCRWAFYAVNLSRVVIRIPVERADLQDYARRAGFTFEGIARDLYGVGADGQVWAMSAARCRWLPKPPPAIPPDTSPPASLKVH